MSKSTILGVIVVLLIVAGLFSISNYLSPNRAIVQSWKKVGVQCLTNGHTNLAQHIHQNLDIELDGVHQDIPANIGVLSNCLAEIHTHDSEQNLIHIESAEAGKEFKLKDFFTIWGEPFERAGYNTPIIVVDTATTTEGGDLILKDKMQIQVLYVGSTQKAQE